MFVKLDTEEALNQRTQTEFADSKQPRRNDCVEDFARREIQAAPEHAQIVIGGVQNNFSGFQRVAQRFQIEIAQWINNEIANRLDSQAKSRSIRMLPEAFRGTSTVG